MVHRVHYGNLCVRSLSQEEREAHCGYWYTVTSGGTAHVAFGTRAGLDRWLSERGLALESELPGAGSCGMTAVAGEYLTASHGEFLSDDPGVAMGPGGFYALRPVLATAELSNGDCTLALITEEDGVRVVNTLNPNVRPRVIFDRRRAGELASQGGAAVRQPAVRTGHPGSIGQGGYGRGRPSGPGGVSRG